MNFYTIIQLDILKLGSFALDFTLDQLHVYVFIHYKKKENT